MIRKDKLLSWIEHRKKIENKFSREEEKHEKLIRVSCAIFLIFMLIVGPFVHSNLLLFLFLIGLIIIILLMITPIVLRHYYKRIPKKIAEASMEYIVKPNLEKIYFSNITCGYNRPLNKNEIRKISTIQIGAKYKIEGYIDALYKENPVKLYKLKILRATDFLMISGKLEPVFDGVCASCKTKKDIGDNRILVKDIRAITDVEKILENNNMIPAELESDAFNQKFRTFSSKDNSDVQYLLTPDVMAKLLDFTKKYPSLSVSIHYNQQEIYIMINGLSCRALFGETFSYDVYPDREQTALILDDVEKIMNLIQEVGFSSF